MISFYVPANLHAVRGKEGGKMRPQEDKVSLGPNHEPPVDRTAKPVHAHLSASLQMRRDSSDPVPFKPSDAPDLRLGRRHNGALSVACP
jgi:hypothetical protein